jgi:hypothetical protein
MTDPRVIERMRIIIGSLVQEKLALPMRFRFKALYATIYRAKQFFTKEELLTLLYPAERARLLRRYEIIRGCCATSVERKAHIASLQTNTFELFVAHSDLAKTVNRIYSRKTNS